jgi:hypothetical protein
MSKSRRLSDEYKPTSQLRNSKGKGGENSMNYSKPEITSLASASSVIQGGTSKIAANADGSGSAFHTPPAYEADE